MTDIDKLEPGRRLDALVAEKVMELTGVGWYKRASRYNTEWIPCAKDDFTDDCPEWKATLAWMRVDGERFAIKPYSTDIAAAWDVFSHHCLTSQVIGSWVHDPNERPELPQNDMGYAIEWFCTSRGDPVVGLSAPHAICLAALKAVADD
jgi:hypothetical protein